MSRLAFASVSLLAYAYVGYPALIAALARLRPIEVRPDESYEPKVSVLVPVHDAKRFVRPKIESLLAQTYPREKVELLFYSDASTDGSDDEVRAFEAEGVKLFRGDKRAGKPTALNVLRQHATGEVFVLTDIRQPMSPNAIRALVSVLADESVGCVSGNLELVGGQGAGVYWKYEKFIRQCEARFRGMVGVTGSLYAIRARDFGEMPADIILDDMWVPFQLRLRGKKIVFEKSAVVLDDAFDDDREKGRKVRTLAGNYQLYARVPEILSPIANPSFFETFSHKLLRLAGPALLAGAAIGTVTGLVTETNPLARKALGALLVGELAFVGLAVMGERAGKLGKLARTFAVLNEAAALGLVRFVKDQQEVTW